MGLNGGIRRSMKVPILLKYFLFTLFTSLWLASPASAQSDQKRPNILWITGENFSNDLGCYGQKNVSTPNLDQLAKDGVRYTNTFSTSPVCAPSRSCFMLGMYQTTTDTHHMRSHRDDDFKLPPGIRPLMHRLKDVGYTTGNITHIGDDGY